MGIEVRGMTTLIQVFDMPTSVKFYCEKLGFELVTTSKLREGHFDWAMLRLNGVELMLNTAYEQDQRPETMDAARHAAHDDTCLYFGCPDVDGAFETLRQKGLTVEKPKVAHYGMKQLYVRDPDGYGLCFQWPVER